MEGREGKRKEGKEWKGQWRHQHSKEARSFRGQNILEPGHPDALFSSQKLSTFFSRRPQNTKAANAAEIVSLSK